MRIFARNINNLTDARYFAAMGVDYMGFEMSPSHSFNVGSEFVKQVKDWVSGPELIACFSAFESKNFIREVLETCGMHGLCFETFVTDEMINSFDLPVLFRETHMDVYEEMDHSNGEKQILRFDHQGKVEDFFSALPEQAPGQYYLDGPLNPSFFSSPEANRITGIVVRGGDEEKTGFKSFEELDDLFEILEQINKQ